MCNLYTLRKSAAEVAAFFGVTLPPALSNAGEDVYPGGPGFAIHVNDEGQLALASMTWGFPLRLKTMKPGSKPKPVNNIADLTKPMWKGVASKPRWRALTPLTAFAEAEGVEGKKTRTWFSVKDQELFAWGSLWRISDEWGPVYSGVMTECNEAIRPVHDRMPVLLHRDEWDRWLNGSFEDLLAFQARCFPDDLIVMNRTDEPWSRRKASPEALAAV